MDPRHPPAPPPSPASSPSQRKEDLSAELPMIMKDELYYHPSKNNLLTRSSSQFFQKSIDDSVTTTKAQSAPGVFKVPAPKGR